MSTDLESNKAFVRELMRAFSNLDLDKWFAMMQDDVVYQIMGSSVMSGRFNKEQLKAMTRDVVKAFPAGIQIHERSITAEGDRVSMEAVGSATSVTGAPYNNVYHFMFIIRDGKLAEGHEYLDTKLVDQLLAGN